LPIALRLIAVPKPGQEPWMMDPIEWLTRPAPVPEPERSVYLSDGYGDFVLVLSAHELRAWHARDRYRAFEGIYSYKGWQDVLGPKLRDLELLLSSANCPSLFVAHWFEWESGLG
jgi:hypothetical protein